MEAHAGPRDQSVAAQAKNHCMGILLTEIGKVHGVSAQEAFQSFGQRSILIDLVIHLPFLLVAALVGDFVVRSLLSRYPPSDGPMPAVMMFALASVVFGIGGVVVGQQWSVFAESLRVGTDHLSNRTFRLPLHQHQIKAFAFSVALFLSIAAVRARSRAFSSSTPGL